MPLVLLWGVEIPRLLAGIFEGVVFLPAQLDCNQMVDALAVVVVSHDS